MPRKLAVRARETAAGGGAAFLRRVFPCDWTLYVLAARRACRADFMDLIARRSPAKIEIEQLRWERRVPGSALARAEGWRKWEFYWISRANLFTRWKFNEDPSCVATCHFPVSDESLADVQDEPLSRDYSFSMLIEKALIPWSHAETARCSLAAIISSRVYPDITRRRAFCNSTAINVAGIKRGAVIHERRQNLKREREREWLAGDNVESFLRLYSGGIADSRHFHGAIAPARARFRGCFSAAVSNERQ